MTDGINIYGFCWGPMTVERATHIEGRGYVLEISTEHASMQIHVTEKGQKIKPYPVRRKAPLKEAKATP